jgi:hypothetical protein
MFCESNSILLTKAKKIINLINMGLELELLLFLNDNKSDLIQLLTDNFTEFNCKDSIELNTIYPAKSIFKDSCLKSIEIIFKFLDEIDLLNYFNLLEWSHACAWNNAVKVLELIYELNACSHSNFPTTPTIISNDGINYTQNPSSTISNEEISRAIINSAAQSGSIEIIEFLLNLHTNVNTMDELGATPLITAVSGSNLASVKFLIEQGANPNIVAAECIVFEVGAFSLSIYLKKWEIAEYLYPFVCNRDELRSARAFLREYLEKSYLDREFNFCNLLTLPSQFLELNDT